MSKYDEYAGKVVRLSDVLDTLDERVDAMTSALIRGSSDTDEETLRHRLGQVQGIIKSISHLRITLGASVDDAPISGRRQ